MPSLAERTEDISLPHFIPEKAWWLPPYPQDRGCHTHVLDTAPGKLSVSSTAAGPLCNSAHRSWKSRNCEFSLTEKRRNERTHLDTANVPGAPAIIFLLASTFLSCNLCLLHPSPNRPFRLCGPGESGGGCSACSSLVLSLQSAWFCLFPLNLSSVPDQQVHDQVAKSQSVAPAGPTSSALPTPTASRSRVP